MSPSTCSTRWSPSIPIRRACANSMTSGATATWQRPSRASPPNCSTRGWCTPISSRPTGSSSAARCEGGEVLPPGCAGRPGPSTCQRASGAAAHPVAHLVAGDTVPVAERHELFGRNLIWQRPRGLIGLLGVTEAPELVDNPLPVICHDTSLVLHGWAVLTDPALEPRTVRKIQRFLAERTVVAPSAAGSVGCWREEERQMPWFPEVTRALEPPPPPPRAPRPPDPPPHYLP